MIEYGTYDKLCNIIEKLICSIEDELEATDNLSDKSKLSARKAIADLLSKVVNIKVQLVKINDKAPECADILSIEDQNIIKLFIEKRSDK